MMMLRMESPPALSQALDEPEALSERTVRPARWQAALVFLLCFGAMALAVSIAGHLLA